MLIRFALAAVLLQSAAAMYEAGGPVEVLTTKSFEAEVSKSDDFWLVGSYMQYWNINYRTADIDSFNVRLDERCLRSDEIC